MTEKLSSPWEKAVLSIRANPANAQLVRDCYYDECLLTAARRFAESSEWHAVRCLLQRGHGRALDIGAGRGIASYALAQDGWSVVALEPDLSDIVGAGAIRNLAISSDLPIEVVENFGERLPFPDESFELVYCRAVLHHAKDLAEFCREAARVLKPGGVFLACREHVIDTLEDLPRFLKAHSLHSMYGGENAFLLEQYLQAFRQSGLHIRWMLNPWASDINLFPDSKLCLKKRILRRIGLASLDFMLADWMLEKLGERLRQPGRLYTFLAEKGGNV